MDDSTRRRFAGDLLSAGLVSWPALESCTEHRAKSAAVRRTDWEAAYLRLEREGELAQRARSLYAFYRSCHLCPRQCGANRLKGETGICQSTSRVKVAAYHPHYGEERPLSGHRGSGTIFFSRCNLLCEYCQNWQISHRGDGSYVSDETLGRMMISLQEMGCHNINLVTPTHYAPNIVQAMRAAVHRGLRLPLVYNCGGYEPVEVLRLLDGIVDIYLPDFKYTDGAMAEKYSFGAKDYPEVARAAVQEMHRQVGDLVVDENGIALRGIMIRHLVLPHNIAGTDRFVQFVAQKLGASTYVNIMAQYRPEHNARRYPDLSRRITRAEYLEALNWAKQAGLTHVDTQWSL